MTELLKPDICVIGAGSGGLSVAAAAAAFGVSVVLIEKGKMGGDCLNTGCVPSKSLIAAGRRARAVAHAGDFGISASTPQVAFAEVHRHVHGVIAAIAPNDFEGALYRARGPGDPRCRPIQGSQDGAGGGGYPHQGAAIRDCDRINARRCRPFRDSKPPPTLPTRRSSISSRGPTISLSSEVARSASSWRRPFAGSGRR